MRPFLVLIFSSSICVQIHAQSLDTMELVNKQSILNGKAWFSFPASAKNVPRSVDIMSADHNANEETRIIMDLGDRRLVVFAKEIYTLGDKNLGEKLADKMNQFGYKTRQLMDKDSLVAIISTPTTFDTSQNAIPVNTLFVKTQDNTVFRIDAYINKPAMDKREGFQKLTERIFHSLLKGTRTNQRNARTETYPILHGKKSFVFALPEGYCVTLDEKYDFGVFKFHRYAAFGDTNWVSLTIYTGDYPSYFHNDYNLTDKDAETTKGKFISKKVKWLNYRLPNSTTLLREQKIPYDEIEKGIIVHIAMMGNSQAGIDELSRIVENVKLIKE